MATHQRIFLRIGTVLIMGAITVGILLVSSLWVASGKMMKNSKLDFDTQAMSLQTSLNQSEELLVEIAFSHSGSADFLASEIFRQTHQEQSIHAYVQRAALTERLKMTYPRTVLDRLALSKIYFGQGEYGLEAASQSVFGKASAELAYNQALALGALATLPNGRSVPNRWKARQTELLERYPELSDWN